MLANVTDRPRSWKCSLPHSSASRPSFGGPEVVERTEHIIPSPARALGSLLGVPVPDLDAGDPLPLLWHWVYLLERPATVDLGRDGHPVRGTIPAPPGPGRRRMWAGGRVTHLSGLRSGAPATRRTSVVSSVDKQGRSGPMTLVTVRHQIAQDGKLALEEEQDILCFDRFNGSSPCPGGCWSGRGASRHRLPHDPGGEPARTGHRCRAGASRRGDLDARPGQRRCGGRHGSAGG